MSVRTVQIVIALAALFACGVLGAVAPACGGARDETAGLDEIAVDGGRVSGRTDGDLRAFLGVPYAAAPVGDLRWRPPQAVVPWQGVRACTQYGPSCPQQALWMVGPLGVGPTSEDCLYLNVWTPARAADERLPVMVFLHGGGFASGSASQPLYEGSALARRGVVVVSVNYRLGPFGYLAHPELSAESPAGVSGNYGLRDQIAALEWVQRNVEAFGGDRGRVTAFGESAGAMSICYLMTSPAAAGLFHQAIVESGPFDGGAAGMGAVRTLAAAERFGTRYAAKLSKGRASDVDALRDAPAESLVAAAEATGLDETQGVSFAPVIDGDVLPEAPAAVFARGEPAALPLIVGANADEANMFLAGSIPIATIRAALRRASGSSFDDAVKLFPPKRYGGERQALSRLSTVIGFWAPARFAAAAARRAGAPSYLYLFTRVPEVPLVRRLGAFHGIELPYVFGNDARLLDLRSGPDADLSAAMMTAWTRFAATGDPNGAGDGESPTWPAYDAGTRRYLEFGDEIAVRERYYDEACDLADAIRLERLAQQD